MNSTYLLITRFAKKLKNSSLIVYLGESICTLMSFPVLVQIQAIKYQGFQMKYIFPDISTYFLGYSLTCHIAKGRGVKINRTPHSKTRSKLVSLIRFNFGWHTWKLSKLLNYLPPLLLPVSVFILRFL